MTEFDKRLSQAIQRGELRQQEKSRADMRQQLTDEQRKSLHGKLRLQLSEHIEQVMRKLPDHFPGFQFQTLFGDKGWGAACSRDDFSTTARDGRNNRFTRLELTIRPYSSLNVLELAGKATVRNKEIFNRTFFEELELVDASNFIQRIDYWVIEFAEVYAAST
jgi:hypothetical protein